MKRLLKKIKALFHRRPEWRMSVSLQLTEYTSTMWTYVLVKDLSQRNTKRISMSVIDLDYPDIIRYKEHTSKGIIKSPKHKPGQTYINKKTVYSSMDQVFFTTDINFKVGLIII